jgi:hypothetical protein
MPKHEQIPIRVGVGVEESSNHRLDPRHIGLPVRRIHFGGDDVGVDKKLVPLADEVVLQGGQIAARGQRARHTRFDQQNHVASIGVPQRHLHARRDVLEAPETIIRQIRAV